MLNKLKSSTKINNRDDKTKREKCDELNEQSFVEIFQKAGGETDSIADVLNVVNVMCTEYQIQPKPAFIRIAILPQLKTKNFDSLATLELLKSTKLKWWNVHAAVIIDCLHRGKIAMACQVAKNADIYLPFDLVEEPLLQAYLVSGGNDIENFVKFIRLTCEKNNENTMMTGMSDQHQQKDTQLDFQQSKKEQFVDNLTYAAAISKKGPISSLLEEFLKQKLPVGSDLASELARLLKQTSTEIMELKSFKRIYAFREYMKRLDASAASNVAASNSNLAHLEKHLFLAYIHEGQINKAESMLTTNYIWLSNVDLIMLIELYLELNNLDCALFVMERACENDATLRVGPIIIAKLVTMMIAAGRGFNEIDAILRTHADKTGSGVNKLCHQFENLLNHLAAQPSANAQQLLEKLLGTLIQCRYIVNENVHRIKESLLSKYDHQSPVGILLRNIKQTPTQSNRGAMDTDIKDGDDFQQKNVVESRISDVQTRKQFNDLLIYYLLISTPE